jgi:hypothetical protein
MNEQDRQILLMNMHKTHANFMNELDFVVMM